MGIIDNIMMFRHTYSKESILKLFSPHGKMPAALLIGLGVLSFAVLNVAVYIYARKTAPKDTLSMVGMIREKIWNSSSFGTVTDSVSDSTPTATPGTTILPSPTASPTPRPLYQGKSDFTFTSGKASGPKLMKGSIDPYDPKVGEQQTLILYYQDKNVSKVEVTLLTDTAKHVYPLTRKNDHWEGTWLMDSRHDYRYSMGVDATSPSGSSHTNFPIR